jgi:hypothetical protein
MSTPLIIMPVVNGWSYTEQAIYDCLGQTVQPRVLVVGQGVDYDLRVALEHLAEKFPDRLLCWFADPAYLSLSGVWNRALTFAWATGLAEAMVVNNDTRLVPRTYEILQQALQEQHALFVSAVGVRAEQFDLDAEYRDVDLLAHGGPDFSCFLISQECHDHFKFDENHIPAFAEDLTYHREVLLAGEGRRIFSVNVPYLHYASQTLKTMTAEQRQRTEQRIDASSRAYYQRVWGGPVNAERYAVKGDPTSARDGVTTPELQRAALAGVDVGGGVRTATRDSSVAD